MPTSVARQLLQLMDKSLHTLEATCQAKIPDLDEPFSEASETFRTDPNAAEAAKVISAAAFHLAAIMMPPQDTLYQLAGGHFRSAAVRACLDSNVTEILREAGAQGLHVNDIAAKNGQDAMKLGRFLRFLSTNHCYREVSPDVFTNNRISALLDTKKASQDIISRPDTKHDGTSGFPALVSHHLDEAFKAAAWSWEVLADTKTGHSGDPTVSPFAHALGGKDTLWEFFKRPEEAFRHRRFGLAMKGLQATGAIQTAFNWNSLPPNSVVVDVGGGVGSSSMDLAKHFPHLKLVVQDLPGPIEEAKKIWKAEHADAYNSGRIELQVQDFFLPQPRKDASVFILKQIMHDWSDTYCTKVLTHLRDAATAQTTLLIIDSIMPFACHDPDADDVGKVPGAFTPEAPLPLLANYGAVNERAYGIDIVMFLLFNSQERTIRHFETLLRSCGWKMVKVNRKIGKHAYMQAIEATPIV